MRCVLFGILMAGAIATRAGAQGSWYYCDAAQAYYPYVKTCPTGWRAVAPYDYRRWQQSGTSSLQAATPNQAAPPAVGEAPPEGQPSAAYSEGQADREAWEAWFASLTGDSRAGADYWAGHRSTRGVSCAATPNANSADWLAGCNAARERLAPSDLRRKAEPDYRLGWNNPPQAAATPADSASAEAPATSPSPNDVSPSENDARGSVGTGALTPAPTTIGTDGDKAKNNPDAALLPATSGGATSPTWVPPPTAVPTTSPPNGSVPIWLIVAVVICGGAGALVILNANQNKKRRADALRAAAAEIDRNAGILRVKRTQTVIPDDYGTVFIDKWLKEKQYFIETRIRPLLGTTYGEVAVEIDTMIERAAQRPILATSDSARRFISNPEVYDTRMNPLDYERHCALLLEKAGWTTRLTVATGDQGADVIAHREGKILVVQCKLYSSPVGNDAVQQVIAAKQYQSADLAAVVSNQPFTRAAKELAAVSGVRLLHHEQLVAFNG
jgi:restriction system protein